MKMSSVYFFAQAYGTGNYGQGNYSCSTQQQQAGTCNNSSSSGVLTNTGIEVAAIVTLACLIVFIGLVVRVWRRKPTNPKPKDDDSDRKPHNDQSQQK